MERESLELGKTDFLWSIHPSQIALVEAEIHKRLSSETNPEAVVKAYEAASKLTEGEEGKAFYQVKDGIAIVPIKGIIRKRASVFSFFFGGIGTEDIIRSLNQIHADSSIESIVLDIDSPGGTVDGTKELSDTIYRIRKDKPVIAYANGMMASAAYWIGSAASEIVGYDTAILGSIGVILTHYDYSEMDKRSGVKITRITGGKYKAIASDEKPLSKEGRAYLQHIVDVYYTIFVDSVARNRGLKPQTVLNKMAEGRSFVGKEALDVGLIDTIGDLSLAIAKSKPKGEPVMKMDMQTFKTEHPDLYKAAYDQGLNDGLTKVDVEKVRGEAEAKGITGERARCVEILSADADKEKMAEAIKEGTPAADAYKAFFLAEKATRAQSLADLKNNAVDGLGNPTEKEGQQNAGDDQQNQNTPEGIDKALALKAQEISKRDNIPLHEAQERAFTEHPELAKNWDPLAGIPQ